jgi:excinuclease UvrABC helicase subunit UvrB
MDHVKYGEEWTKKQKDLYTENHYHKPSDEYDPNWDLSGMVEDLQLLFQVGLRLGNEDTFPNWKEGTEFRAKRDRDMEAARKLEFEEAALLRDEIRALEQKELEMK